MPKIAIMLQVIEIFGFLELRNMKLFSCHTSELSA